jgi:hypothetical protein
VKAAASLLLALAGSVSWACPGAPQPAGGRLLDDFDDLSAWSATASDGVSASLRQVEGPVGKALCLAYDFNGYSGYAVARRELPLVYPEDYEFALQLRGSGPINNLEFKLVDASGDNVWWVDRKDYPLPLQWTPMKLKKRHIGFAWGPTGDKVLRRSQAFELTISAGQGGGKGEACIDQLALRELSVFSGPPPRPLARASAELPGGAAGNAVDDDPRSAWRTRAGPASLVLDLGRSREFGGLTLHWLPGLYASRYGVSLSEDGSSWRAVRTIAGGNGASDPVALPESEARFVRLELGKGPGNEYALAGVDIEALAFAATPNDFMKAVARSAPRGWFPRGLVGEQPYWTILGIDGGSEQGLLGEDGAVELNRGGPRVEPFVLVDGVLADWADVRATQSLKDGYLPIPSVAWRHSAFALAITAFAQGTPEASRLVARYRLVNSDDRAHDYALALAVRPLQVNPPSQFLSTMGGVSPIHALSIGADRVDIDGRVRIRLPVAPDVAFATTFDGGMAVSHLAADALPAAREVGDATGLASGAALYRFRLAPGESREVAWFAPLSGTTSFPGRFDAAAAEAQVALDWHQRLDRVRIRVPAQGRRIVDTLRSALAQMLMSREGPRLQPGPRSYARAWIRDGAMISDALLRLGRADVAGEFLRWYAPHQFDNGKVPCCVDDRGSDPVPENDSQGEFIHAVASLYRHAGERRTLATMWPHVAAAVRYMDTLRLSERTAANRAVNPAFFGLMPASISHEGYSAKPMHSYWDDFWALRGYKDAVEIARWLGRDAEAREFAASRDQFRADLHASLELAVRQHGIGYIPGSAELGDFDPTSTTISLAPGGEQASLPPGLLHDTFERYWDEFVARRDGTREWQAYTPYELRTVGTFVRLGWRGRALEALDFFLADRQPPEWNQWAEVVSRTPRKPFFLGDLPHAWVASDYARSVLDLFAYAREDSGALVLAAGIPRQWLEGEGIAVEGLGTPYGTLDYSLRLEAGRLRLRIGTGATPAGGFVVALPDGREIAVPRAPVALSIPELTDTNAPAGARPGS